MSYASDITDKQWQVIEPLITYKGYCRPRKYELRRILNGIFYVLRSGCQWRMLPKDLPPWKSVYDHYYRWRLNGTWDRVHDTLRDKVREKAGKSRIPTVAIIDSRSVKSTQKGGLGDMTQVKKSRVAKHHIGVDTLGLLLAAVVHSAHISDTRGIRLLLIRL